MLRRKIEQTLEQWRQSPDKKPLVIKGCRQCGKTFSVMQFAKGHYKHVAYVNFMDMPGLAAAFEGDLQTDTIVMGLSAMLPGTRFVPGETCIVLDEIQECPRARTALKTLKIDGRFDVICTGSLLGVQGYGNNSSPVPVGYEEVVTMCPLDFEEFLWACGVGDDVIAHLKQCMDNIAEVPPAIHNAMRQRLLHYVLVGGMPEAVNTFIATHDLGAVLQVQRTIVSEYKDDMLKYAPRAEKAKIRECFESIPRQLSRENKKFQYSTIKKGGRASQYEGSLQWIEDAGIIVRCYNLSIPELPLDGNVVGDTFKVYMADTGLFVSMLEDGTQADILGGKLGAYKGAIFENLVADIFSKTGRRLYYYHKDSGLEVDFVTRLETGCTLVEVKAATGNVKSAKTILAHPEKYKVAGIVKFGDYNVGRTDPRMLTRPLYMAFLLH